MIIIDDNVDGGTYYNLCIASECKTSITTRVLLFSSIIRDKLLDRRQGNQKSPTTTKLTEEKRRESKRKSFKKNNIWYNAGISIDPPQAHPRNQNAHQHAHHSCNPNPTSPKTATCTRTERERERERPERYSRPNDQSIGAT